jgi:hypothetical protein
VSASVLIASASELLASLSEIFSYRRRVRCQPRSCCLGRLSLSRSYLRLLPRASRLKSRTSLNPPLPLTPLLVLKKPLSQRLRIAGTSAARSLSPASEPTRVVTPCLVWVSNAQIQPRFAAACCSCRSFSEALIRSVISGPSAKAPLNLHSPRPVPAGALARRTRASTVSRAARNLPCGLSLGHGRRQDFGLDHGASTSAAPFTRLVTLALPPIHVRLIPTRVRVKWLHRRQHQRQPYKNHKSDRFQR